MGSYSEIDAHGEMVYDRVRNRAYLSALEQTVKPGSAVLDLGAGLGLHGLMAARLGADPVYLVEPSPVVQHAAELAQANRVGRQIRILRGRIEEVDLPQRVDLIVSVLTGNFLLEEDLLPSLFSARDRFLSAGGSLVPDRARMFAALAQAEDFHERHVRRWSKPMLDLDFSSLRRFAGNAVYFRSARLIGSTLLSEPVQLQELDFHRAARAACHCSVELRAEESGRCHGIMGWFDLRLGARWISTGPGAEAMHWGVAFLPLDPPIEVAAGQAFRFGLDRPETGDWTWTVSSDAGRQRHSTFQSKLMDLELLRSRDPEQVPGLGRHGQLARAVLTEMAADKPVDAILAAVRAAFSDLAAHDRRFDDRVRSLLVDWGEWQ